MKIVYICSPLRGDIYGNTMRAIGYCKQAVQRGLIPIAPHVYCQNFLDDALPEERAMGMRIGIELLKFCDALVICGTRISEGMAAEIAEAKRLKIPVRWWAGA